MSSRDSGIRLPSSGLQSKWGFNDGDIPDSLLDWIEARGLPEPKGDWHIALRRLVREWLLPLLPDVEVRNIETAHNPIRVADWTMEVEDGPALPEASVLVPFQDAYDAWAAIPREDSDA